MTKRGTDELSPTGARADEPPRAVTFFSGSKDRDDLGLDVPTWRKELSNFAIASPPIVVAGRSYRTVEHAFQAGKYLRCARPEEPARRAAAELEVGGRLATAHAAKIAGGRRGMGERGCALDRDAWALEADGVMMSALRARAATDATFSRVLRASRAQRVTLVHHERAAAKSYWGGGIAKGSGAVIGRNRLGEMLMELRETLGDDAEPTEARVSNGDAGTEERDRKTARLALGDG